MDANLTPVATAIHALSFEKRNQAYEHGQRTSRNKLESLEIARSAAQTLGTNPSYEEWVDYMDEWKAGYMNDNPEHTTNAADQAWKNFVDKSLSIFGLSKPRSNEVAALKKAAEREAKTAQLLEKHKDATAHDLRAQLEKVYTALAKNPTNKDLKKAQKEVETVLKAKTSEENKAHGEQLKALRAQVREAASKCTDLEQLEAALDCLSGGFEINYSIE